MWDKFKFLANVFKDRLKRGGTMNTTPQTPSADLAKLYFFSVLDFLVDLAHTISHDFIGRPQLYTNLEVEGLEVEALRDVLGSLYVQYGTEPTRLGPHQRNDIFNAIFGIPGGNHEHNSFVCTRDELREACRRNAANVRSENKSLLEQEVRTALVPFQQYLVGLQGSSVNWSLEQLQAVTAAAYRILMNDQIARVFGVAKAPQDPWPFAPDPNGNILVEEISERRITRGLFGQLQQVALNGAQTIDIVLARGQQVSDELIRACNAWSSALTTARKTCCSAGLPYIGRT